MVGVLKENADRCMYPVFLGWLLACYLAWSMGAVEIYALLIILGVLLAVSAGLLAKDMYTPQVSQLSPEELAQQRREAEKERQEKAFRKSAERMVKYFQKRIPEEFGLQLRMQKEIAEKLAITGKRKLVRVVLRNWIVKPTEVWFPLTSKDLPPGVSYSDILSQNNHVEFNLGMGINRECKFHIDQKYHYLFLRVPFLNGKAGLPIIVYWRDLLVDMWNRPKLAVPLGVDENGKVVTKDLSKWPHGLIMGATGQGKSTFMRQALCTLLMRNTSDELNFYLIDLKRTDYMEFIMAKLPHIQGYANDQEKAIELLQEANDELERRLKMFEKVPVLNIDAWNHKMKRNKLPHIFVWIDELSWITASGDNKHKKAALPLILRIAQAGRSAGLNLLIGTQTVDKATITMPIKANVEGKLCFRVHNVSASILAVEQGVAASELPVPGRCVLLSEKGHTFYQAPIALEDDVKWCLDEVNAGRMLEKPQEKKQERWPKTIEAIAEFSLETNDGLLDWDNLYQFANGAWPHKWGYEILKEHENKIVQVNGGYYKILPHERKPGEGTIPRRLVPVDDPAKDEVTVPVEPSCVPKNGSNHA